MASHAAVMLELKWRKSFGKGAPTTTDRMNRDEPLTQIHLRLVLAGKYKTAKDFKGKENPQRLANMANIKRYLSMHAESDEFNSEISYTAEDINILADVLEWEEEHKENPTFYHVVPNGDLYALSLFFKLLKLDPLAEKILMRGTDIYFKDVKTMSDILEKYGEDDDRQKRNRLVLAAHLALTSGYETANSVFSPIEHFLNDFAETPTVDRYFKEAAALAGVPSTYDYFRFLFLQYFAKDPAKANNTIVAITAPVDLLEKNTYPSYADGRPYRTPEDSAASEGMAEIEDMKNPAVTEVLEKIQAMESETARDLFPEVRMSLHPDFAQHPLVKMKAFHRFPLTPTEQKEFDQEMRDTVIAVMAAALRSNHMVMPDSLKEYPALKRLFSYVRKGMGHEEKENISPESVTYLLANGHIEADRKFLVKHPDALHHEDIDFKTVLYDLVRTHRLDALQFVFNEVNKKWLGEFFKTPQNFYKTVRICLGIGPANILDYLLSQYDLKSIDPQIVEAWIGDLEEENIEHANVLLKYFPDLKFQIQENIEKEVLESRSHFVLIDYIQNFGTDPEANLKRILKKAHQPYMADVILEALKKVGVDLSAFDLSDFKWLFKNNYGAGVGVLVKRGRSAVEVFQSLVTIKSDPTDWGPVMQFAREYSDELKDVLTEDDREALGRYDEKSFFQSLRTRYVPEASAHADATVEHAYTEFKEKREKLRSQVESISTPEQFNSIFSDLASLGDRSLLLRALSKAYPDNLDYALTKDAFDAAYREEENSFLQSLRSEVSAHADATVEHAYTEFKEKREKLRSQVESLSTPEQLNSIFSDLVDLGDRSLLLRTLRRVYPDVNQLLRNTDLMGMCMARLEVALFSDPSEAYSPLMNSMQAINDYLGDKLPQYLMQHDGLFITVVRFLNVFNEDILRNLWEVYPALFTYRDATQDFFEDTLNELDGSDSLEKFVLHFQNQFRLLDRAGTPYFWNLLFFDGITDKIRDFVESNPDLFMLNSIDGLSLEELGSELLEDHHEYREALKKLKRRK